ncbi:hypothetical protein EDB84DRAFT_692636 [Lactarius hengduanensis]|nr:hypothetical protein EDB84DRAFT_692636 [Lactarius hengduanensis]
MLVFKGFRQRTPNHKKLPMHLCAFAKSNEGHLYTLLETCMDIQTSLKSRIKSSREFLRRIEQSSAGVFPTFAVFLRSPASLHLINQSSILSLLGDSTGDGPVRHSFSQTTRTQY